jgi:hypothetical protein
MRIHRAPLPQIKSGYRGGASRYWWVEQLLANEKETIEEVDIEDRVEFKVVAARYHLRHLRVLSQKKSILGGEGRREAEMLIEAYITAVLSASEAIEVEIKQKTRRARRRDLQKELMTPIKRLAKERCSWLWRIKQLRNMSAHTQYIPKFMASTLPEGTTKIMLLKDPTDLKSGPYHLELIPDLEEMLNKTVELTSQLRSRLREGVAETIPNLGPQLVDISSFFVSYTLAVPGFQAHSVVEDSMS